MPARGGPLVEPPRSLDAKTISMNQQKASNELHATLKSVESEIQAMETRMRERKGWSRLEEVKEEEAALLSETQEVEEREAERAAKIAERREAAQAHADAAREAKRTELEASNMAELEARAASGESPAAKGQRSILAPPTDAIEGGGGIFRGLFSGFVQLATVGTTTTATGDGGAAPPLPPAVPVSKEAELAALRAQYKASDRKVHELRSTGGVALQAAYEEYKALKAQYRAMRDEVEAKTRKEGGAVARTSAAGTTSARRLERQREREAARKKSGRGERPAWQ